MSEDRYAPIAHSLRRMGWLQDRILHRARMKAVEMVVKAGARTVLDACCGAGTLSRYLDAAGLQVLGVDASPAMLLLARRQAPGLHWIQADVTRLELGERVDATVIALALHEMSDAQHQAVWRALQRLTRPDGILVVMDYTIPPRATLAARVAGWVIRQDERALDRDDPGHYGNYLDFLSRGGARGWLAGTGAPIVDEASFLFGNLGVFRLARTSRHRP
jgi:ubiquinone/menaquinone biosynthesis C-methylase UbiE